MPSVNEVGVWTTDMGEISGFGGSYEEACRNMVRAGVKWLADHPDADPKFHGYKNIYGVIQEDNDDAKDLSRVMVDATGGDCTGAMHQASVSHVLAIKAHGWDWYCEQLRAREREESSTSPTPGAQET